MMKIREKCCFVIAAIALALMAAPASADILILTGNASSWGHEPRPPAAAVDGSGLTGTAHDMVVTNGWLSRWGTGGALPAVGDQWFEVKLGGTFQLASLKIWNCNEDDGTYYPQRQVKDFTIWYANNPSVEPAITAVETFQAFDFAAAGWTQLGGAMSFPTHTSNNSYTGEAPISLGGILATHLAIDIDTNHGDANFVGIAEIQIMQVPEPGYIAMVLGGLLGLLAAYRRRD